MLKAPRQFNKHTVLVAKLAEHQTGLINRSLKPSTIEYTLSVPAAYALFNSQKLTFHFFYPILYYNVVVQQWPLLAVVSLYRHLMPICCRGTSKSSGLGLYCTAKSRRAK